MDDDLVSGAIALWFRVHRNMFSQVASPLSFYTPMVVPEPLPMQAMDPSPSDAYAIFIHPPFTTFPDSNLHPDGLTYAVLAANPDWFLDPHDFISVTSSSPTAIQYPIRLEPPRKRNLKALGSDGVTENGEPRFRCTFCRKNYAGENAKSMWRRHVVKRHGIAMSNRREIKKGASRGGRRANSEYTISRAIRIMFELTRIKLHLPLRLMQTMTIPVTAVARRCLLPSTKHSHALKEGRKFLRLNRT